jgi:hypothetical protein
MHISGEQQGNKTRIEITYDTPEQVVMFEKLFHEMLQKLAESLDSGVYDINGKEAKSMEDAKVDEKVHERMKNFSNWL